MKLRHEVMLGLAVITFAWVMTQRAAKPTEPVAPVYTCETVRLGVELVGTDPAALEELANQYGFTVSPAQRKKAMRCLRRIKWAKRISTSIARR